MWWLNQNYGQGEGASGTAPNEWQRLVQPGQSDTEGFDGWWNPSTGVKSTINPNAVSNPLYQVGTAEAQGEGATSTPVYANQNTADQYLPYKDFLNQALSDNSWAALQRDPGFNMGQYFDPANGAQAQNLVPQANKGLQALLAGKPDLQQRYGWTPWSDYGDFNRRHDILFPDSGWGDIFGGLTDIVGNIANVSTLGMGDSPLANVFPTVFNDDVHQAAIMAGAGQVAAGGIGPGPVDQAGTAAYGGLDGASVAQGMGAESTAAGGLGSGLSAANAGSEWGGQGTNMGLSAPSTTNPPLAGMGGGTGLTIPAGGTGAGALSPGFFASEGLAPGGGSMSGPGGPSVPSTGGAGAGVGGTLGMVRDGLSLGGGLYNLYQANQSGNAVQDMLNQANQQAAQNQFPHGQYRGLVDQYMNDPMSLLRNNPGYLASVDYLTKAGQRQMAGKGFNNAGNKDFYLADVLGKNAQSWWRDQWQPIAQTAGVTKENDPARLASVQANAMNSIFQNQQQALGSVGKAAGDFLGSSTGKKAWDWAFG